jgi:hypothetical protein
MTQSHQAQAKPLPGHDTREPRKLAAPAAAPVKRDEPWERDQRDDRDDRELPFTD